MPRKARSYKRHPIHSDYKYNSIKIGKFINYIMERGKKTVASKIVYDAIDLIEKPKEFVSNDGITGFYIYDNRVFEVAKSLKPSGRGELEITDLHRWFLNKGEIEIEKVKGRWIDAGTFDSLLEANIFIAQKEGSNFAKKCAI